MVHGKNGRTKSVALASALGLAAVLFTGAFSAAPARAEGIDFSLMAGVDGAGEFESGSTQEDADLGWVFGLELAFQPTQRIELGGGLEYGFPRDSDTSSVDGLDYLTVYGVVRIYILGEKVRFYAVGRYGYTDIGVDNPPTLDIDQDFTWSIGPGFRFGERIKVELLYNSFSGDISSGGGDFEYTNWSARLHWVF
jgi:hypothetical protein